MLSIVITLNARRTVGAVPDYAQDLPDEILVKRAMAGDQHAFESLVRRHYGMVFAVALARLRDPERAGELAQEVFVRACFSLTAVKEAARFPVWLCRMTQNLAIDWLRRRNTASRLLPQIPLDSLPGDVPDPNATSARSLCEDRQEKALLENALGKLGTEDREVICLHFIEGLSKSEMARRLDVHPSSIGRRLDRALSVLRHELGNSLGREFAALKPASGASRAVMLVAAAAALPAASRAALAASSASDAAAAWSAVAGSKVTTTLLIKGIAVTKAKLLVGAAAGVLLIGGTAVIGRIQRGEKGPHADTSQQQQARITTINAATTPGHDALRTRPGAFNQHSRASRERATATSQSQTLALAGTVTDPAANPVSGATVTIVQLPSDGSLTSVSGTETRSDASGKFSFELKGAGALAVVAAQPGYQSSRTKTVRVGNSSDAPDVVLALRTSHFLAGIVRDTDSAVSAGTTVTAQGLEGDDDSSGSAVTDSTGRFRIEGLSDRTQYVGLESKEFGNEPGGEVATDTTDAEFTVGKKRKRTFLGMVVDSGTGEAIREFTVTPYRNAKVRIDKVPGETGLFKVYDSQTANPRLQIEVAGCSPLVTDPLLMPVDDDMTSAIFWMGGTCAATGTVVEAETRRPLPGVEVKLGELRSDPSETQRILAEGRTDENGRYRLETGQYGFLEVSFTMPGRTAPNAYPKLDHGSTVDNGITEMRLGAQLRVRLNGFPPQYSRATIHAVEARGFNNKSVTPNPDGTLVFEDVVSGRVAVRIENLTADLVLEPGRVKEIELKWGNASLAGSVRFRGETGRAYVVLSRTTDGIKITHDISVGEDGGFLAQGLTEGLWGIYIGGMQEAALRERLMFVAGQHMERIFELRTAEELGPRKSD